MSHEGYGLAGIEIHLSQKVSKLTAKIDRLEKENTRLTMRVKELEDHLSETIQMKSK